METCRWIAVLVPILFPVAAQAADTTPPGSVEDLRVVGLEDPGLSFDPSTGTLQGSTPLLLVWTESGDDGPEGSAWRLEAKMAPGDFGAESWDFACRLTDFLRTKPPSPPGEADTLAFASFAGLSAGGRYTIRVRLYDEAGNAGPLSNPAVITIPGASTAFSDTLDLDGLEFWAWGKNVPGPRAMLDYEGSVLRVNGFARGSEQNRMPDLSNLIKRYREAPQVLAWIDAGATPLEATLRFHWECEDLASRAGYLFFTDSIKPALELLRSSPLVENVKHMESGTVEVTFKGLPPKVRNLAWNPDPESFTFQGSTMSASSAHSFAEWLEERASRSAQEPGIALLAGEGFLFLSLSEEIARFREQVAHLRSGKGLDRLPEGPLTETTAREVLEAGK